MRHIDADSIRRKSTIVRPQGNVFRNFFKGHKNFFYFLLSFLIFVGALVYLNVEQWLKLSAKSKQVSVLESESKSLVENKSRLEKEIDKMRTERGIEETFREDFLLAKPGEKVFVILDENEEKEDTSIESKKGFWQAIIDFLFFWR